MKNLETYCAGTHPANEGIGAGRYSPGTAAMLMRTGSCSLLDDPARRDRPRSCSSGVSAMLLAAPGETRWFYA
jgi:hypothetical protein